LTVRQKVNKHDNNSSRLRLNLFGQNPTSFLFNVAAARTGHQTITQEILQLNPIIQYEASTLGTEAIQVYRLTVEPCDLQLQYRATIDLRPKIYDTSWIIETGYSLLPNEVLPYLNPSRYCESDRLTHFALRMFGNIEPGFSRVTAICDWINNNLDYQAGSSGESTSACDVLIQRVGVCRDYAHLAIALCRALCIPARYISGYAVALQPPDFHGFLKPIWGLAGICLMLHEWRRLRDLSVLAQVAMLPMHHSRLLSGKQHLPVWRSGLNKRHRTK